MQVLHTGGQEQELDVLEAGEGKGVDNLVDVDVDFFILYKMHLYGVVVDHQHGDVLGPCKRVTLDCVDSARRYIAV